MNEKKETKEKINGFGYLVIGYMFWQFASIFIQLWAAYFWRTFGFDPMLFETILGLIIAVNSGWTMIILTVGTLEWKFTDEIEVKKENE
jgi:hypothetical protein